MSISKLEYYKFKAESLRTTSFILASPFGIKITNSLVTGNLAGVNIFMSILESENIYILLLLFVALNVFFRSQDMMEERDLALEKEGIKDAD